MNQPTFGAEYLDQQEQETFSGGITQRLLFILWLSHLPGGV